MAKVNRKEVALTADQISLIEKRASQKITFRMQPQIVVAPSFFVTIEAQVPDAIDNTSLRRMVTRQLSQEGDELKVEDIDSPEPMKLDFDDSGTKLKLKRTNTFRLKFNTNIQMM